MIMTLGAWTSRPLNLHVKMQSIYSTEVALTEEQMIALDMQKDVFLAGDYKIRAKIVKYYLRSFKDAHPKDTGRKFPVLLFETVGALSLKLGCCKSYMGVSSLFPNISVAKMDQ